MSNTDLTQRNTMGIDRGSYLNNFFASKKQINQFEIPHTTSLVSVGEELMQSESQVSAIFERSQTKKIDLNDGDEDCSFEKHDGIETLKLTNLRQLLRLFRINLQENNRFEYAEQWYQISFAEFTPLSSRDKIFKQKPLSMESDTSPTNIFKSKPSSMRQNFQSGEDDIKEEEEELNHLNTAEFNQSPVLYDNESNFRGSMNISQLNKLVFKKDAEVQFPEPTTELKPIRIDSPKFTRLPQRPSMEDYQQMSYEDIIKSIQLDIEDEDDVVQQVPQQKQESFDPLQFQQNLNSSNQIVSVKDNVHQKYKTAVGQNMIKSLDFSSSKTKKDTEKEEELRISEIQAFTRSVTQGGKLFRMKKENQNIQQMSNENKILQEQLNEALQKLESLNSMFIDQKNVPDAKLHFVFLFASPLVLKNQIQGTKEEFKTKALLEFKKEFQEIKSSIKETKKVIRIKSSQATIENLTIILGQGPMALHFSGHGILNNVQNFGKQYHLQSKDGDFLLFETVDGDGELVSEKTLKELITKSKTNLEFVFVASCHSQFAGQIFLNAGAKHVICIRTEYTNLTICEAFDVAKAQVEVKFKKAEANKFILLKKDEKRTTMRSSLLSDVDIEEFVLGGEKEQGHQCKVFGPLKDGDLELLDVLPIFKEIPSKVDDFLGRQKEVFEVVYNMNRSRLVNIIGLPGIGKTSLAKNAVHFMSDRRIFKQGIIFIPLKGYTTCEIFIKKLLYNLIVNTFNCDKEELQEYSDMNSEELLMLCFSYIKEQEEELLIVFDNAEDLLYHDKLTFRNLVTDMLYKCPQIRILMTSRAIVGALPDISEKILVLKELNSRFSLQLLFTKSREITEQEQLDLLDCLPLISGESPTIKTPQSKDKKITLQDHHLFQLLGGNPHAIILAAPLLIKMSLKELYLTLNSKEMHEVLKVDGISNSTVASLRLSLEASIKYLERENKDSISFFFFIGLLPGGIYEEALPEMWGEGWEHLMENLVNFSLIQKKVDEEGRGEVKYALPPFMNNYAEAKITEDQKLEYQNLICHYYAVFCKKILDRNGKSLERNSDLNSRPSELHHQVMEYLLKHEANIWACIARMIDQPLIEANNQQFESNDEDLEEENKLEEDKEIQNEFEDLPPQENIGLKRFSTLLNIKQGKLKRFQTLLDINDLGQESPIKVQQKSEDDFNEQILSQQKQDTDEFQEDEMPHFQLRVVEQKRQSVKVELLNQNKLALGNSRQNIFSSKSGGVIPINIENEEEGGSSSGSSVNGENDNQVQGESPTTERISIKSKNNPQEDEQPGRKISKSIIPEASPNLLEREKEEKLDSIVRNSIINFQRPSGSLALNKIKNFESRAIGLQRRSTVMYKQQKIVQGLNKSLSGQMAKKKIETLHAAEQMIIYYAMNLVLLREQDNALHLIGQCGSKVKGSTLYEANLKRIEGLIYFYKQQVDTALSCFKIAKGLYEQSNSLYGEALSYFSIAYIYRSKLTFFIKTNTEENILMKAEKNYQKAFNLFKQVNHIVGNALCNKELALIYDKKDKRKSAGFSKEFIKLMQMFLKFRDNKNCPHIQRIHGHEISLMSELVIDNENRNLFQAQKRAPLLKEKSQEQIFDEIQIAHQKSLEQYQQDKNQEQKEIFDNSVNQDIMHERSNSLDNLFERKSVTFSTEVNDRSSNNLTAKVSKVLGQKVNQALEVVNEEEGEDEQVRMKKSLSQQDDTPSSRSLPQQQS